MAEAPVPAPQPACLDNSGPITPLQSATIRYILIGALTSLLSIVLRVAGRVMDADYIKDIADNGADFILAAIQLWFYYRAYKARIGATKTITTAPAATVETKP